MKFGRSRLLQFIQWLLLPFSAIYGVGVRVRNKLFDWNILPSNRFDIPVISIGNISVGGSGKTPHVEYLIQLLQEKDLAVLSRGYGRKSKGFQLVNENDDARKVGDEPLQVRNKFPNIRVAVCERRVEGIHQLLQWPSPPALVLLDDAFQHRYVKPGLSIVLVNYHHLIYNDWLLPAGRLREPLGALKRAHAVVVSKCPEDLSVPERDQIASRLYKIAKLPIFFSYFKYGRLKGVFTQQEMALDTDCHILLVTGIADPGPLKVHLKAPQLSELHFPDHHDFTASDVRKILKQYTSITDHAKILLTTEKDAQRLKKWQDLFSGVSDYFYYLPVEVDFLFDGREPFNKKILQYLNA